MALPKNKTARNALLDAVAGQYVQQHANSPVNAELAGANDAFYGIPDIVKGLALAANPNLPTFGDVGSGIHLARQISKAQEAAHPVFATGISLPLSMLTGSAEMHGLGAIGQGVADMGSPAAKVAGNVLKAVTEFRPATGKGAVRGIARVAGNIGSGIAQGGIQGATHALGTGGDLGAETGLGAVGGGLGAAAGEGLGALGRRGMNLISGSGNRAARMIVQENPDALAARLQALNQQSGTKNPLAAALSTEDAARAYAESLNKDAITRTKATQAFNARKAQAPTSVAKAVNIAAQTAPAPAGMDTSPIADMASSPDVRGPNPTVGNFKAIQAADMTRAMDPIRDQHLAVADIPAYGAESGHIRQAILRSPALRAQIPNGGTVDDAHLTVGELDGLRQSLNDAAYKPSTSFADEQALKGAADAIGSHIGNSFPEYQPALDRWAAQQRLIEGFNAGKSGTDPNSVETNYKRANLQSPEGQLGQQVGTLSAVRDQAASSPENAIKASAALASGNDLTRPVSPDFGQGGQITQTAGPDVASALQQRAAADTQATDNLRRITNVNLMTPNKGASVSPGEAASGIAVAAGSPSPFAKARVLTTFLRASGITHRAAQKLTDSLLDPSQADAVLANLQKTHPNLALTSKALRSLATSANVPVNAPADENAPPASDTPSAPAASASPWDAYPAVNPTTATPTDPKAPAASASPWDAYPAVNPSNVAPPAAANQDTTWHKMVNTESGGNQFDSSGAPLTSSKGAIGAAQVMPATAPEAAAAAGVAFDPVRYKTDPAYNQTLGYAYFQKMRDMFGDDAKAAAAYNAGPGNVQQAIAHGGENWLSFLPAETQNYVARATS